MSGFSLSTFFPFSPTKKNGIWLLSFFLPQKLTPLSLDTHITIYVKGKFSEKNEHDFFSEIYLEICASPKQLVIWISNMHTYYICREWISNDPKWMVFHVHFCLLNRPFKWSVLQLVHFLNSPKGTATFLFVMTSHVFMCSLFQEI